MVSGIKSRKYESDPGMGYRLLLSGLNLNTAIVVAGIKASTAMIRIRSDTSRVANRVQPSLETKAQTAKCWNVRSTLSLLYLRRRGLWQYTAAPIYFNLPRCSFVRSLSSHLSVSYLPLFVFAL